MNNIKKLENLVNYLEEKRYKHPALKYKLLGIPPFTEETEKKAKKLLIYIGGNNEKTNEFT